VAGITVTQPCLVQYLLGVGSLTDGDARHHLTNLDSKIVAQGTEVTHLEHLLHFQLELVQHTEVAVGDDQVINVDASDQHPLADATHIHAVFSNAALEAEFQELLVQLHVPRLWCLPKTVKHLV
jgi:hypothetical protein